ncbi:MAG: lipid-A-disaccharide synthase [Verrucomicrobiota bacterium]
MQTPAFMLMAGEPSGDLLAAELVAALRATPAIQTAEFAPQFFGAGGPRMAAAGVGMELDLTAHAVVGFTDVLTNLVRFHRLMNRLVDLAFARRPDVIICVDFSGFNRRFARAVRNRLRTEQGAFHNWNPKLAQFVSPQVWASRPRRADAMARDFDLLLCLFPFEKSWYARRRPDFRVEFVGHPIIERHAQAVSGSADPPASSPGKLALVVLLPGSRVGELKRHVPVMLEAARRIAARHPARFVMVLPDDRLAALARGLGADGNRAELQVGGLTTVLANATLALACTGTVTLECALARVPTIAIYRTSALTYQIARRLVTVQYLAMPNLLASEPIFPEFIQGDATPQKLAAAALALLEQPERRRAVRAKLAGVVAQLGEPGAAARAASAIVSLLKPATANQPKATT